MEDRHLAEEEQDQINFLISPRRRNKGRRNANRYCANLIGGNDSSTTVNGTSVPSKIESPPRQPATYSNSVIEIPPQRHATPFRSTTDSPRKRPAAPVQNATDSPAQNTIISISNIEPLIRDAATATRNVSESPRQQSVISISSTAESPARESFTPGQNVKRPTPSPITPAGTVQDLDATAASINKEGEEGKGGRGDDGRARVL